MAASGSAVGPAHRPYQAGPVWLSPSRPLVGSVCPQGSRTGACLLRLRLLLLLDLPLSLAGARPLGSSDKADPVAQIRTSGRGRDPPRGLGGGWPPPPLATVACSSPGPRPQASAVDTRPRQSTSPSDSRLPSGSQAGTLLPAQTGLFLEEEDEAAGAQACCLPSLLTPPPGILSRGWAGPLSPPDPRRKMQHLFRHCLGTAYSTLHLRASWLSPGHPSFWSPAGPNAQAPAQPC